jgi:hypothetical protein
VKISLILEFTTIVSARLRKAPKIKLKGMRHTIHSPIP